jgi:carbon storage regulator
MLVLSRKPGEKVVIGGNVTLTVISCDGSRARIGITAPDEVRILRGELFAALTTFDDGAPDERPAGAELREAP